ncbi:MAG: MMPL family transporter [Dehalococcoidia bacterium]|nr:MMPL family transporter [Dehalococcoidia bacterium]
MARRTSAAPSIPMLERWAHITHRRRGRVMLGWIIVVAALVTAMSLWSGKFSTEFTLPGSESQKALDLLRDRFPAQASATADLVFEAPAGVTSPDARAQIEKTIADVSAAPKVAGVESPFDSPGYISQDGTIARTVIHFDGELKDVKPADAKKIMDIADANNGKSGVRVETGGDAIVFNEMPEMGSEMIGMLAAVVILLIAFGSVVAMGLPIVAALFGLISSFAVLTLLANFFGFPDFSSQFAAMIGIGVGIDYSLLVVTRFREGLHTGHTVEESVVIAVTTAGKSVIFAGIVVALAFLGLYVVGLPFVAMLGTAGALVVLIAVIVAVTITPAALSLVGHRIDSLKLPLLHQSEGVDENSMWYRLSRRIQRSPVPFAVISAGILLLMALPVLKMDLGFTDAGNGRESLHSRRAYDLLAKGFGPGFNGPILAVVDLSNGGKDSLDKAVDVISKSPGIAAVVPPILNEAGDTAILTVFPTTKPQADETTATVKRLRNEVTPQLEKTGARYYMTGSTAGNADASTQIQSRMPLLFAGVIGLSFLLLTAVFRSVVIAVKAAIMNLLSIGAAYGVVVAIFQFGWGGNLLGVDKGPVEVFLPMMMFAMLFGLSMDYEVFLISRVREEYLKSGNTATAVANGLTATARVITAAAAIMVTVFLAFVLGPDRIIKEFGIGLATAIFVDATIVRVFLVPSTMELLREANWWMPKWLDRLLPNINVEGPERVALPGGSPSGGE